METVSSVVCGSLCGRLGVCVHVCVYRVSLCVSVWAYVSLHM